MTQWFKDIEVVNRVKNEIRSNDRAWGFYLYKHADEFLMGDTVISKSSSGLSVNVDTVHNDFPDAEVVTFIHGFPSFTPKEDDLRHCFSGVDIGSEFAKVVHCETQSCTSAIAFKRRGADDAYVYVIEFRDRTKLLDLMEISNSDVSQDDILSITSDGYNNEKVDWFEFQSALFNDSYYSKYVHIMNLNTGNFLEKAIDGNKHLCQHQVMEDFDGNKTYWCLMPNRCKRLRACPSSRKCFEYAWNWTD